MNLCAVCGHLVLGLGPMCGYHTVTPLRDDWAAGNRIMCDFLHRGIVPHGSGPSPALSREILFDELAMPA